MEGKHFRNKLRILIPVPILEYSIRKGVIPQVRIFIFLKINSSGSVGIDYKFLQRQLGIKSKITLQKHLSWLKNNGWLNIDKDIIYLRSWKRIYAIIDENKDRTGVYLDYMGPLLNNQIFKAFAAGASFSLLVKYQKSKKWRNRFKNNPKNKRKGRLDPERAKGRSELRNSLFPFYFGVSNSVFSQRLNISKTHAIRLKTLAEKYGFIKTKEKIAYLKSDNEISKYIKVIRNSEEIPFKIINKSLCFQSYDEIVSNMALGVIPKNRILY